MPAGVSCQTYSGSVDGPRCDHDNGTIAASEITVGGVISGFTNPNLARHYLAAARINGPHDVQKNVVRSTNNFIWYINP